MRRAPSTMLDKSKQPISASSPLLSATLAPDLPPTNPLLPSNCGWSVLAHSQLSTCIRVCSRTWLQQCSPSPAASNFLSLLEHILCQHLIIISPILITNKNSWPILWLYLLLQLPHVLLPFVAKLEKGIYTHSTFSIPLLFSCTYSKSRFPSLTCPRIALLQDHWLLHIS